MAAVGEGELASRDGPDADAGAGLRVPDQPGQAVVIGEGQRGVAQLRRARGQGLRLCGAVEQAETAVAVELAPPVRPCDVNHNRSAMARTCFTIATSSSRCPWCHP